MRAEILTIFPELLSGFLGASLIKKAIDRNLLEVALLNPRDFAAPPHFKVDDSPYGGGAGMVMLPEPLAAAIEDAKKRLPKARVVLMSAAGRRFDQRKAYELSRQPELILVCGRYEGVDQRVVDLLVDEELSMGDYVLMGGEVPAMAVLEAAVRLVGDVVGNAESIEHESFGPPADPKGLLEAPQYTRPPVFRGVAVPEVLLSGNHRDIDAWRSEQSRARTAKIRPDLAAKSKA
jgi:tRNA (guanine37-N1)-methyltransferase